MGIMTAVNHNISPTYLAANSMFLLVEVFFLKKKLFPILIFPSLSLSLFLFLSTFTTCSNYFPHHNLFLSSSIISALYFCTHTLSNTDIHPCLLLFLASEGLSCLPPTLLIGSLSLSLTLPSLFSFACFIALQINYDRLAVRTWIMEEGREQH